MLLAVLGLEVLLNKSLEGLLCKSLWWISGSASVPAQVLADAGEMPSVAAADACWVPWWTSVCEHVRSSAGVSWKALPLHPSSDAARPLPGENDALTAAADGGGDDDDDDIDFDIDDDIDDDYIDDYIDTDDQMLVVIPKC